MEYENNEFEFSLSKSTLGFKYHKIFIVDKRGGSAFSLTGDQVDCLIDGLYHLTSHSSRAADKCLFGKSCREAKVGCAKACLRYRLSPA